MRIAISFISLPYCNTGTSVQRSAKILQNTDLAHTHNEDDGEDDVEESQGQVQPAFNHTWPIEDKGVSLHYFVIIHLLVFCLAIGYCM